MFRQQVEEKILARVASDGDCEIFTGGTMGRGYGTAAICGKSARVHRAVYEYRNGEIPEGMMVCHSCDNRKCVKIDHLFLGTAKDNSRDMTEKRRQFSILKESDVPEIRVMLSSGNYTQAEIGEIYGVGRAAIAHLKSGRTWSHVK